MRIFTESADVRKFSRQQRQNGKRIGFVPTMGFLHQGHLSLVEIVKQHCEVIIASIYVNPTQFAAHEDFDEYPMDQEADLSKLKSVGCDAVFLPASLYNSEGTPDSHHVVRREEPTENTHQTFVRVERLEQPLCGQSRPHFFRGVATVVTILFNIVEPDVLVLGRKDYQQYQLIKTLTKELKFDIEVIGGPIVRELDGLAMSSRNALLAPNIRPKCKVINESLEWAKETLKEDGYQNTSPADIVATIGKNITKVGGKVDYIQVVDARTLKDVSTFDKNELLIAVAVFFPSINTGSTVRLIDNVEITLLK